jgi:hypothetical protein
MGNKILLYFTFHDNYRMHFSHSRHNTFSYDRKEKGHLQKDCSSVSDIAYNLQRSETGTYILPLYKYKLK